MLRTLPALLIALPAAADPLDSFQDCPDCPVMIELPVGEFVMGAPEDEFRRMLVMNSDWYSGDPDNPYLKTDEGPQHTVTMDLSIAMGRDEITYDQWMACVNDGGCGGWRPHEELYRQGHNPTLEKIWVGGDHPVNTITYERALLYVDWLNARTGTAAYRLPTEAEWEYAARAGTQTTYYQGETITTDQANFSAQDTEFVMLESLPHLLQRGFPVPVGALDAANAWGLRHMSGNMREITGSCYTYEYVGWTTASEWLAAEWPDVCERTIRGGGYFGPMDTARVAWRAGAPEDGTNYDYGFRVVRDLPPSN